MEATGVFSSCVTELINVSCCSLRRISRNRKIVFEHNAANDDGEKQHSEEEQEPGPPVQNDPGDGKRYGDRYQARAQRDEKGEPTSDARPLP